MSEKPGVVKQVLIVVLGALMLAVGAYASFGVEKRGDPVEANGPAVTSVEEIHMGAYVYVESDGEWYDAVVKEVGPGDAALIHYDGWDSKYDEVVPISRIRKNVPQK